jgi:hypothetical protein
MERVLVDDLEVGNVVDYLDQIWTVESVTHFTRLRLADGQKNSHGHFVRATLDHGRGLRVVRWAR